jgi:hypothetical protein
VSRLAVVASRRTSLTVTAAAFPGAGSTSWLNRHSGWPTCSTALSTSCKPQRTAVATFTLSVYVHLLDDDLGGPLAAPQSTVPAAPAVSAEAAAVVMTVAARRRSATPEAAATRRRSAAELVDADKAAGNREKQADGRCEVAKPGGRLQDKRRDDEHPASRDESPT